MKSTVIFSGTTEGRLLAESFATAGEPVTVCVATEYGREVMKPDPLIEVHTGRLDEQEMEQFLKEHQTELVFDATHPYAEAVSRNLRQAAAALGITYKRLERDRASHTADFNVTYVKNTAEAVKILESSESRIMLTTGSKELNDFRMFRDRLYVRVLPSAEAIRLCEEAGIEKSHVVAEQGPFTCEENLAFIKRFDIGVLVTKASGRAGGYDEKVRAAQTAEIPVITIKKPSEMTFGEPVETSVENHRKIHISVIGAGCGEDTLTLAAAGEIKKADLIIGSKRLLDYSIVWENSSKKVAAFMPDDINAAIADNDCKRVAVLFSGDTGFYSGAEKFLESLSGDYEVEVFPGISSVQALSAKVHLPYNDAAIRSFHGKDLNLSQINKMTDKNRISYFLFSGKGDAEKVLNSLADKNLRICTGIDLGSKNQQVVSGITEKLPDGKLYIMVVENKCVDL